MSPKGSSGEVILRETVKGLGEAGDVVRVKPGYARNFLFPQGKAMPATKANLVHFEERKSELLAAHNEKVAEMRQAYRDGIAWGAAKQIIFETLNTELEQVRQNYEDLMANPAKIEQELEKGAVKARQQAKQLLAQLKDAVGIRPIT